MDATELRAKVLAEIQQIPENKLVALYELLHQFRLHLESPDANQADSIMRFAGCWNDLSDDAFNELVEEVYERRRQAFSGRSFREIDFD
jgi:hypothetical protein